MTTGATDRPAVTDERRGARLPVWWAGLAGGTVGMLCCVGPTVLALLGVVGASTAFVWSTALYDGYAWWFRAAGLVVLALLAWWALRRRRQCSIAGVRRRWVQLAAALGVAVATYAVLYAVTTWLGTFAAV